MIALLLTLLLLAGCGGSSGTALEQTITAEPNPIHAYNLEVVYLDQYSELQDLVEQGGELRLPCGTYTGITLEIKQAVSIIGSGPCTVIPPIRGSDETRYYRVNIQNLTVDGALDEHNLIGIDFRNISASRVTNVAITNVDYGVLLYKQSYYNTLEDLMINAKLECYEIVDVANENTLRGGRCLGGGTGMGMYILDSNNTKVFGTSFENLDIGLSLNALGTSVYSIRLENMQVGIELLSNSRQTTLYSVYRSNLDQYLSVANGATYKSYGF